MILTAVFAVIIIYLFAICGYLFIQDDFLMEVNNKPFGIDFQNGKNMNIQILPLYRDACCTCITVSLLIFVGVN